MFGSTKVCNINPFPRASCAETSAAPSSAVSTKKLTAFSSSLPASIFEKSRMLLINPSNASADSPIVSTCKRWRSSRLPRSRSSAAPTIAVSGVRSSWLIVATNCDLNSDALSNWRFSSSTFAACSCIPRCARRSSSARRRSVISVMAARVKVPPPVTIGLRPISIGTSLPSLRIP
jgi:hypothetical protein